MKPCRECQHSVSEQALLCPNCGAPRPALASWSGWGFEYKTKAEIMGLPLLHVSFKYKTNFMPVPAVGIVSIGQFGAGVFNISQFGVGLFSLGQFVVGGFVIAQFGIAYALIAQFGLYVHEGYGQVVKALFQ